ncbi:right-handed parallel beta-helix repeat-containing protein [Jiangella aurantiaca]|uniref:Right-handed parallel beta-helix repeat-containing protein n=1 Tax=Jiangella aurantiaca TaxID=2530373 RepID=A0A4V2YSH8_9ACTN|nr:right-handed parallel beta-helix repeat-containing protein [Jiangella aurantiaca]TDD69827.1 right-handed parallel beta-helix repeat-containing protein [Jiangella aurantiaca]
MRHLSALSLTAGVVIASGLLVSAQKAPIAAEEETSYAVFYVSPSGSDADQGTEEAPFGTLERARQAVAELAPTMTGDIEVVLRGGTYQLTEPLRLGPADSGTGGYQVSYEAYPGEQPVLSGGIEVTGWTQDDWVNRNRWKAPVPAGMRTRQLYVDGVRADRSRVDYGLTPTNQSRPVVPAQLQRTETGFITNNTAIQQWTNPQLIEFVWSGQGANSNASWMEPRCRVESISGTSTQTTITMRQPCFSKLQPALKNDQTALMPTYVEHVLEATYRPGQWYLDETADTVYYVPRGGEDVTTATVIAPRLEQLVVLAGTPEAPVHDISFSGITFAYTTWLGPSTDAGYPEQQANVYTSGNSRVGPPGTVAVVAGRNIRFEGNHFAHAGAAGLEMRGGTQDSEIVGNVFTDISGNAVQLGGFVTRHPAPEAEDRGITVENNYIDGAGAEYKGAVGILAGYVADTTVAHNEVTNVSYTGISVGWGWTSDTYVEGNRIEANNVHDVLQKSPLMHDGGGIYTLGSTPDAERSVITRNWVHDIPYAVGGIYLDAGSDYFDVTENVISESDARTWFFIATSRAGSENVFRGNFTSHTQYQTQSNTGGNTVADNQTGITSWPDDAQQIMREAGLEPSYRKLTRVSTVI